MPARPAQPARPASGPKSSTADRRQIAGVPGTRAPRRWGLLGAWFRNETPLLTTFNAAAALFALMLALPMTEMGVKIAAALDILSAAFAVMDTTATYLGTALILAGALMAVRARAIRKSSGSANMLWVAASCLLLGIGMWLALASIYTHIVPSLLTPALSLAGGPLTTVIDYLNHIAVLFFKPALAVIVGLLLVAKQIKTSFRARLLPVRRYLALVGAAASICVAAMGATIGHRHYVSGDDGDWTVPSLGPQAAKYNLNIYAPPFAYGVRCHISDGFGTRTDPFDRRRREFHPGIDVAVARGTPIHAMASGRIVFAGHDGTLGNMVAVQPSGETVRPPTILAGHMEKLFVRTGDVVRQSDVIGIAGSTGRSTGPHLHLQLCPTGHASRGGGFDCGTPANPYEAWRMLFAIARASCALGPVVPAES